MSIVLVLGGLVAFVAPILLHIFYFSGKQVLYEGAATCRSYTKTVFERERRYALVFVDVPGVGEILAEISHARALRLSQMTDPVTVKVVKQPFKSAQIESIAFAGETAEPAAPSYDGLGLSLYFFVLAVLPLLWLPGHTQAGSLAQHVALFFSAFSFAAAGFSINALSRDKIEVRKAKASLLFIPLGSGYFGLYTMWTLAVAATIACFWQPSIFILLGLNTAFAAGSIPGVLWRNRTPKSDRETAGPLAK
jgi:hypothetical protein